MSLEAIEAVVCLKDWNLADKRLYDHDREAALVTDTVVCLKDWNLANKRLYDHDREAALVTDTENLHLSKHEWIHNNSPSPENSD